MDETLALRAQIQALSGKISARRADPHPSAPAAPTPSPAWAGRGRGGGARGGYQPAYSGRGRGRGRGRGGATGMQWTGGAGVRNKTLVLNQPSSSAVDTAGPGPAAPSSASSASRTPENAVASSSAPSGAINPAVPSGFVKRHDRGSMSLVTSDTYKKLEAARAAHVAAKPATKARKSRQEILEKRKRDRENQAKVARLQQHSKVLAQLQYFRNGKGVDTQPGAKGARTAQAQKGLCAFFTRTGKCKRGLTCAYKHDPAKLALCPRVLSAQGCTRKAQGKQCLLSHTPNAHRVPHCAFFTRHRTCKHMDTTGTSTDKKCVYTHSDKIGPDTKPCEQFSKLGYCENGKECDERHTFECPEFAASGKCSNPTCRLMHIVSAGGMEEGGVGELVFERDDAAAEGNGDEDEEMVESPKKKGKRKRDDGEDVGDGDLGDEAEDDVEDFSYQPLKKHHGKSFITQQDFISFGDVSEEEEDEDHDDRDDDEEEDLGEDEDSAADDDDDDDDVEGSVDGESIAAEEFSMNAGDETEDAFEDAEEGSEAEAALGV
ncbi:unnamed protein product [Tilletia laevis]|uniref:C3H1-type domain-containing protein n=2 Tax=Tilletia TaxID=13289 RepID=A0A177VHF1_9BASI|nr:hypothetical protein CF336_g300 [Tilletia laevis]KAE8265305.1 hypothetical protein A4X03_0g355 [Tilletia caries]KAE8208813.1 hypothetical protein CF335_g136 [Tilletia laevis]CAD6890721.1 unnamed protein product [Tilletia caries]CAD6945400.1 unnamed protein product [Tilletia caries]